MVFSFDDEHPIELTTGEIMARNYFITGGAGFIGSNYVHRLVLAGRT